MSDTPKTQNSNKRESIESSGFLLDFFVKYGKVLIVFSIFLLISVVSVVVYNEVQRSRINQATILIESLEEAYIEFLTSEDAEASDDAVIEMAQRVISQFPNTYFHQRALLIQGLQFENQENFIEAAETFLGISDILVESHLVEIGLIRAYQNFEAAGNLTRAIESLELLIDLRPQGIQVPRSIFNIARLLEARNDSTQALEYYQRLNIEFPTSSWTNLAQARILFLQR